MDSQSLSLKLYSGGLAELSCEDYGISAAKYYDFYAKATK